VNVGPEVASYISPKCRKGGPSQIEGAGLRALESIGAGEVVAVKGGHIVDAKTLVELAATVRNSDIQITDHLYLAALDDQEYDAVMLYLNHSCNPTVGVAGNVVFVTMHDISAGEELTIDYAMIDDHEDTMDCHCRQPNCRGTVSGQDWRRPELQARYGGYFSSYLQARFSPLRPAR
jgi:hypothetical protein